MLDQWAYLNGIEIEFSRPGKPTDNAFCEAFNGRVRAETLCAHSTVEGLTECVVRWLSWSRELDVDAVEISPLIEHPAGELRTVVTPNSFWLASFFCELVKDIDDLEGLEVRSRNDRKGFSRVAINNRQKPERAAVEQGVGHEVHRPAL